MNEKSAQNVIRTLIRVMARGSWIRDGLFLALSVLALVTGLATCPPAQAIECIKASIGTEKIICGDRTLRLLDDRLSLSYFAILRSLRGTVHDALVADQRRWLAVRELRCGVAPDHDGKADCIRKSTTARIGALPGFEKRERELIAADEAVGRGTTGGTFAGDWSSCDLTDDGNYICDYKKLFQNGNRVCGIYSYWATAAYYDGQIVGTVDGDDLTLHAICGRPDGETSHNCPRWESTKTRLNLCGRDKSYLVGSGERCPAEIRPLKKFPFDPEVRLSEIGTPDTAWISYCLSTPAFPATTIDHDIDPEAN